MNKQNILNEEFLGSAGLITEQDQDLINEHQQRQAALKKQMQEKAPKVRGFF